MCSNKIKLIDLGVPPDGVGLSVSPLRSRLPHSLQTAPVGRITPIPHAREEGVESGGIGQKILSYFGLWQGRDTPIPHALPAKHHDHLVD